MTADLNTENHVLVEQTGSLGVITLNRPKALNSLTYEMVQAVDAALTRFEGEPSVAAVLVCGAGERGLCAGGDIRQVLESVKAGKTAQAAAFWRDEYRMNARISHFPKPYIAIMDGITMGGGVGISAHGSHRIVTERLRLAMPETGIGFFPDVGATWLLTRKPGEFGLFMGLTGEIIGADDAIRVGLADAFVPSEKIAALREALSAVPPGGGAGAVSAAIARFVQTPPPSPVSDADRAMIDRVFAHETVEGILAALEQEEGAFAARILGVLNSRSPTALKIALRMLRLARGSPSLEECLNREFAGSAQILTLGDFHEGVRAAVIDKDRNPRWQPASLAEVTEGTIAPFFKPHQEPPFGRP
ncbi:enoyl-CoA hydratase/isomerase family protein [Rhizobium sp. RU36D]|uniref:enoyl-CoA hydratase/isomerase family protein n=1 Tax=Rhizobium sp. RU36D TaxID=1907415 RepID=UPI0009D7B4BE|nr:enoyl-CoA hydratase/isomerase family protein [Rhizobium sp. RU36D]SMC99777.1 enoyl-CoA hydratase [Rhizobium sp. RU36D]